MRHFLLAALAFLCATLAQAAPYGTYDLQKLLSVTETPTGKKHGFDTAYLDRIVGDLALHARNYPPRFDTPADKERASQDAGVLAQMLDKLVEGPSPAPALLLRAAFINSIGHNLDLPGAAARADALYRQLLTLMPADPLANYQYGAFLAGVGKAADALPHLEKALATGVVDAAYTAGFAYLALGNKDKALEYLERYRQLRPADANVGQLIDAIRNGRIETQKNPL